MSGVTTLVVGGSVAAALVSLLMAGFALFHGIADETLLFPATILSATLLSALATVLVAGSTPAVLAVVAGAVLVDAGATLVFFQTLLGR